MIKNDIWLLLLVTMPIIGMNLKKEATVSYSEMLTVYTDPEAPITLIPKEEAEKIYPGLTYKNDWVSLIPVYVQSAKGTRETMLLSPKQYFTVPYEFFLNETWTVKAKFDDDTGIFRESNMARSYSYPKRSSLLIDIHNKIRSEHQGVIDKLNAEKRQLINDKDGEIQKIKVAFECQKSSLEMDYALKLNNCEMKKNEHEARGNQLYTTFLEQLNIIKEMRERSVVQERRLIEEKNKNNQLNVNLNTVKSLNKRLDKHNKDLQDGIVANESKATALINELKKELENSSEHIEDLKNKIKIRDEKYYKLQQLMSFACFVFFAWIVAHHFWHEIVMFKIT